ENERLSSACRAAEEALFRYRSLFEHAPDGLIETDLDGRLEEANLAAAVLLRSESKDLVGRLLSQFVPTAERKHFSTRLAWVRSAPPGEADEWEVTIHPRSSAPFDAALRVARAGGHGQEKLRLLWA